MPAPIPPAYVTAHMHGGPCDGQAIQLPWARVYIPMPVWAGNELVEVKYNLRGPWLGHPTVHYDYAERRF